MKNRLLSRTAFALLSLALCSSAHALSFRAYLSSSGSDSNPCTASLPCRLLPAALDAVMNGGEVWMVDSANFNTSPVQITKSVSILAIPGAVGSVVSMLGGPAINIATPGVRVSLRNVVIVPLAASGAGDGIVMTNGESLTIQETLVAKLPLTGIDVRGPIRVKIMDSVIRDSGAVGVRLSGGVVADISNSKITGNTLQGVFVHAGPAIATTTVAVNDSFISANAGTGLAVLAEAGSTARLTAIRTTASHNATGFSCDAGAGATVSCSVGYSMATRNSAYGFEQNNGSTFRSMGNNIVIDNTINDTLGTITPLGGS